MEKEIINFTGSVEITVVLSGCCKTVGRIKTPELILR